MQTLTTTQTGCLTDPSTFGGVAFTNGDSLEVRHALVIDGDATVGSLRVHRRGTLNIEANLTVQGDAEIHGLVYQLPGSLVSFDSAYHDIPDHGITVRLLGKRAAWIADGTEEAPCHLWSSSHGGFAHFVSTPRPIDDSMTFRHAEAVDVLGVPCRHPVLSFKHVDRILSYRRPKPRPFSLRRLLTRVATLGHFGH